MSAHKHRRPNRQDEPKASLIPTDADWHSEGWHDLESPYAYKNFSGKTFEEAQRLIATNALSRQEDLAWMPDICLRYYIRAYIGYLKSEESREDADAASAFLSLVRLRRDTIRNADRHVLELVAFTLDHLAENQAWYDAEEEIYGIFAEQAKKAKSFLGL